MADSRPSTSSTSAMDQKKKAMKDRLKKLHLKRTEASRSNHREVVEENKRNQLPANFHKKREWADKQIEEEEARLKAQQEGRDFERDQFMGMQADEAEKWEARKRAKHNPDTGFSDFEAASARKYHRDIKAFNPDMEEYERTKEEMGEEAFYAGRDTMLHGTRKDSQVGIDRMVKDLEKQIDRRSKHSRRRTFDADADVDYINNKNMAFNKKLEKYYGQYTTEIKQNLERGTAI